MSINTGIRNTQDSVQNGLYPFFVRSNNIESLDSYDFDCEAVLTAGDGVGTGKVFHYYNGKFSAHQRVYVLKDFRGIDGKYFFYWFSHYFYNEVLKYTAKSSVDSVRRAMISEMPIILPPLKEQKAIAKVLSELDDFIEKLDRQIEKKQAIRDGMLEDLVSGKRRLPGFEGEWTEYLFDDYFVFISTNTASRNDMQDYGVIKNIHYGDVLIKHTNIISNFIGVPYLDMHYITKIKESHFLMDNDVVIADTAEDFTVGKAVQLCNVKDKVVSGLHTFACRPIYKTACGYLGYYLNSKTYHDSLIKYVTGIKVSSISKSSIKKTYINLPSYEEQTEIVNIIQSFDNELVVLKNKQSKYSKIKQGLMEDLLTGNIRLNAEEVQ